MHKTPEQENSSSSEEESESGLIERGVEDPLIVSLPLLVVLGWVVGECRCRAPDVIRPAEGKAKVVTYSAMYIRI